MGTTSHAGAIEHAATSGAGGGGRNDPVGATANDGAPWAFPTDRPFAEYLPQEFAGDANFKDIKSFDGLLKGFVNAQKMVGLDKAKLLVAPKDDADTDAYAALYKTLGRPEKFEEYKLPKPEGAKEYADTDKAFQAAILPVLHKAGLTQRQVSEIVPAWNALMAAAQEEDGRKSTAAQAEADAALTKEWGAAKAAKLGLARESLAWLDGELELGGALTKALEAKDAGGNALGNSPALLKLFSYFGEQMKEDGLIGKADGSGGEHYSPNEARQQIAGLQGDEKFMRAYLARNDPGHADAVKRMEALYAAAYPEAPK